MTTDASEEKTMKHRPFGSTKREVAVIGQGTWNIEQADCRGGDRRFAPRSRSRHDAYRHRGDVWFGRGGESGRRGDRRAARRGLPRLQGPAAQRVAEWDDRRLRAVAEAAQDRPARLLSSPLARVASSRRYRRRLRAAERRRQDPVVGRQQFRRGRSRRVERGRGSGQTRLQSGALSFARARDRACRDPVVRRERCRGCRLQPVRPRRRIS